MSSFRTQQRPKQTHLLFHTKAQSLSFPRTTSFPKEVCVYVNQRVCVCVYVQVCKHACMYTLRCLSCHNVPRAHTGPFTCKVILYNGRTWVLALSSERLLRLFLLGTWQMREKAFLEATSDLKQARRQKKRACLGSGVS